MVQSDLCSYVVCFSTAPKNIDLLLSRPNTGNMSSRLKDFLYPLLKSFREINEMKVRLLLSLNSTLTMWVISDANNLRAWILQSKTWLSEMLFIALVFTQKKFRLACLWLQLFVSGNLQSEISFFQDVLLHFISFKIDVSLFMFFYAKGKQFT